MTEGLRPLVLAKVEYLNPGGSVKDRIAVKMIEAAEAEGKLKPGGTIVEPTSGNTGVGLAIVAQAKGYSLRVRLPGQGERGQAQRARRVRRPGGGLPDRGRAGAPGLLLLDLGPAGPRDRGRLEARPVQQPQQPGQPLREHRPGDLWRQTEGKITHFVAGIGTGGTISGTGRYLKEVSDGRVQVVGADPAGSVYSGGTGRPYLVEGVGEDFWPANYDRTVCDRVIEISDGDSFALTRRLAREEALLVGGSSGMAVAAALRLAAEVDDPDAVIVVLLPDSGRGYLTKVFSDDWLTRYGFAPRPDERPGGRRRAAGEVRRRCRRWCTPIRARPSPRRSRSCASTASPRCRWSGPSRR